MSDNHALARHPVSDDDESPVEVVAVEKPRAWERQEWETATAFQWFSEFYLAQSAPRYVVEAYRRWREQKRPNRGPKEAQLSAIRNPPGSWKQWAYGTDEKGHPIPGRQTWSERAAARDAYLIFVAHKEEEELWRTRRKRIHELEFTTGEKLMERVERMQAKVLFERSEQRVVKVGDQEVPQLIIYSPGDWSERDIASAAKVASELMRRGADLPIGKLEADWRRELAQQFPDLDPDEVQMVFINGLIDLLARRNPTV